MSSSGRGAIAEISLRIRHSVSSAGYTAGQITAQKLVTKEKRKNWTNGTLQRAFLVDCELF